MIAGRDLRHPQAQIALRALLSPLDAFAQPGAVYAKALTLPLETAANCPSGLADQAGHRSAVVALVGGHPPLDTLLKLMVSHCGNFMLTSNTARDGGAGLPHQARDGPAVVALMVGELAPGAASYLPAMLADQRLDAVESLVDDPEPPTLAIKLARERGEE